MKMQNRRLVAILTSLLTITPILFGEAGDFGTDVPNAGAIVASLNAAVSNNPVGIVYNGKFNPPSAVRAALVQQGVYVQVANGTFVDASTNIWNGYPLAINEKVLLARLNDYGELAARIGDWDILHSGTTHWWIDSIKTNLAKIGITVRRTNDLYIVDSVQRKVAVKSNVVVANLNLLAKAKELAGKVQTGNTNKYEALRAYRETWRLCIQNAGSSDDRDAQVMILNEWNSALSNNEECVASQLYALSDHWDRMFLTDEFWQLLERTQKRKIISAISYVLYGYGDANDAAKLLKKMKQTTDIEMRKILQNAINYINYRLKGGDIMAEPFGPQTAPPHEE